MPSFFRFERGDVRQDGGEYRRVIFDVFGADRVKDRISSFFGKLGGGVVTGQLTEARFDRS